MGCGARAVSSNKQCEGGRNDGRLFPNSHMYCEGRPKPLLRGVCHGMGVLILLPVLVSRLLSGPVDEHGERVALGALLLACCALGVLHELLLRGRERMWLWVSCVLVTLPSHWTLSAALTLTERALAVLGLLCYAAGALVFGGRLLCPLLPGRVLGSHEVFHALTLLGGCVSFALLASLSRPTHERCAAAGDEGLLALLRGALAHTLSSPRDLCAA